MIQSRWFGPQIDAEGVTFRLWAPAAKKVELVLAQQPNDPLPMPGEDGWYELKVPSAKPGARYQFRIDGELNIPDPASHFQPDDVAGASEVIDHTAYAWQQPEWKGRPWHEAVFSEIHVGTYTPDGSYRAIIDKLGHIVETGITAIELMPLSDFPGRWNWGYDGVLPFAPDSVYGRPDDLKALIDAAHARGVMVFLDVVYNHFGPEGNYLPRIVPEFFTDAHTPWGSAIDYRVPGVRAFVIDNVLHWLRDYRFDGLRFDAVHAIVQPGEVNILNEISLAVAALAADTGRHIHLVLENDDNRASLLSPDSPADGRYRAQWNDDNHHAWHVLLTGETAGYYRDYKDAGARLARTLAEGFAYQGEPSLHRDGTPRGEPSGHLPTAAFVNFIQNHDQIGNRARGERLTALAKPQAVEAALTVLLLSPPTPLLYMGEEWGALEPFPFFCDFKGDLANAVREGRKKEFAEAYAESGDDIPDPLAEETKRIATLDWSALKQPEHSARLDLVRKLLTARRQHIVPMIEGFSGCGEAVFDDGLLTAAWEGNGKRLSILANLSDKPRAAKTRLPEAAIWGVRVPGDLSPWSVYVAAGAS